VAALDDPAQTICAIATPPGSGGVGVLRLSGDRAEAILRRLCPALPPSLQSHRLYLTRCVDPSPPHETLDEVLAVLMRGPRSYTGEDVVELQAHGGWLNLHGLLRAALAAGAAPAGPGAFTSRAFLRGRLDLTQAEAVADMIHAQSDAALKLARQHLEGRLGAAIAALRERLVGLVVLTEAAIDFSGEEHVYQLDLPALLRRLEALEADLDALLGTWDAGRQAREGVRVALLGRPNAGKSTLFNALCGEDRAIVTAIPGTTRDWLEEGVVLDGVALRLVDTAGLRDALDPIEREGVARSLAQARRADLLLWLIDGAAPLSLDAPQEAALLTDEVEIVPVINKIDLPRALTQAEEAQIEALARRAPLRVSLTRGDGVDALRAALAALAAARVARAGEGAVLTRARHREAVTRSREALARARETARLRESHEFIALDLRLALEALGEVVGAVSSDDLLARIFSEFCVGK
jgi:tRNA modification GTPase